MICNNRIDLTHLSWTLSRKSSGTAGSFLKSYEELNGIKYYYKLSNFDTVRGIYGHECINEMIAQNVAEALGIPPQFWSCIKRMIQERRDNIEKIFAQG